MVSADGIRIRSAHRGDVDAIHAMIEALAEATGAEGKVRCTPLDVLRHGFAERPAFEALIAEAGDVPVGLCVLFFTFSTWLGEPGVYVQDLYVARECRGTGLGRRLLAAAVRRGRERDATHLRLSVGRGNESARRFYERLGMEYRNDECIYHAGSEAFVAIAEAES